MALFLAAEFSEDIRRHLAGDRVLARDDTFRYRMERIVRRLLHPANGVFHTQGMILLTAGLLGVIFLLERHEILSGRKASANRVLDIHWWRCGWFGRSGRGEAWRERVDSLPSIVNPGSCSLFSRPCWEY